MEPRCLFFDDLAVLLEPAELFKAEIDRHAEVVIALAWASGCNIAATGQQVVLGLEGPTVAFPADTNRDAMPLVHQVYARDNLCPESKCEGEPCHCRNPTLQLFGRGGHVHDLAAWQDAHIGEGDRNFLKQLLPGSIIQLDNPVRRSRIRCARQAVSSNKDMIGLKGADRRLGLVSAVAVVIEQIRGGSGDSRRFQRLQQDRLNQRDIANLVRAAVADAVCDLLHE